MAARGTESKERITNQILATFPGAFKYDKEIRIPVEENGEIIQIKVALTAAKVNVEAGGDTALPGSVKVAPSNTATVSRPAEPTRTIMQPTADEKHNVEELLSVLGLNK